MKTTNLLRKYRARISMVRLI